MTDVAIEFLMTGVEQESNICNQVSDDETLMDFTEIDKLQFVSFSGSNGQQRN